MKWSKNVLETWTVHEALRRLGFTPEEIFIIPDANAGEVFVQLQAQGKKFDILVGPRAMPVEEFLVEWEAFAKELPALSDAELIPIWFGSEIYRRYLEFVTEIAGRGFRIGRGRGAS